MPLYIKTPEPSLRHRVVRALPQKRNHPTFVFQGKARKGLDQESTSAVGVVSNVPLITKYVATTHNMAKKLGKVGGRKGGFVCCVYYTDKVPEGKQIMDKTENLSVIR